MVEAKDGLNKSGVVESLWVISIISPGVYTFSMSGGRDCLMELLTVLLSEVGFTPLASFARFGRGSKEDLASAGIFIFTEVSISAYLLLVG
jgi:hypothetical protein